MLSLKAQLNEGEVRRRSQWQPAEELLFLKERWPSQSLPLLLAKDTPKATVLAWSIKGVRASFIKSVAMGHTKSSCAHREYSNSQPLMKEGNTQEHKKISSVVQIPLMIHTL